MKYKYETQPNNCPIKILMCGNVGVVKGMILTALSLSAYSEREIVMYIGTMDLSDLDGRYQPATESDRALIEAALKRSNPNSRCVLLDFGEMFRRELMDSKNLRTAYTPYAMIRLFADEVSELSDKLLYLDTDTLFLGDVGELYDVDIVGYEMAGALDYFGRVFINPRYMNSGVLLLNMEELRATSALRAAREMCRVKKMLLMDQTALNRCVKRKLYLPRRFNEQHGLYSDTLVRHFSMTIKWLPYFHTETVKPWQFELVRTRLGINAFDGIFEDYITLTERKEIKK